MKLTEPNQFGQSDPIETDEEVREALVEFDELLNDDDATPPSFKASYLRACQECPDIADNEAHKLRFLRCDLFQVQMAVNRMCRYWIKRIEVFGEERAFLKITLDQAMKDDHKTLALGIVLHPLLENGEIAKDKDGRCAVYFDPSRQDSSLYTHKSLLRVFWYVVHIALETETTQKRGIILIVMSKYASHSQFDTKLSRMISDTMKGCLPARIGSFQVCHPPIFFSLIYPIIKYLLGSYLRERIRLNRGSDDIVIKSLQQYGLPLESIPSDLGGGADVNNSRWFAKRKAIGK